MNTELYYLWINEQQKGPFTLEQLRSMWRAGAITAETLYWQENMVQWTMLGSLLNIIDPPAPLNVPSQKDPHIFATVGTIFIMGYFWISGCRHNDLQNDTAFWRECSDQSTSTAHNNVDAFTAAELYVARQLKSPSTAKFCSPSEATITEEQGRTIVLGWVDSENSFGAHPRAHWCCTLRGKPGNFVVSEFLWK